MPAFFHTYVHHHSTDHSRLISKDQTRTEYPTKSKDLIFEGKCWEKSQLQRSYQTQMLFGKNVW